MLRIFSGILRYSEGDYSDTTIFTSANNLVFDKPLCGLQQTTDYGIQAANGSGWICMGQAPLSICDNSQRFCESVEVHQPSKVRVLRCLAAVAR